MRTVHIGANVPCRFVWRGDPEKIGEAKKLLFLPSLAEVAQEVKTMETLPGKFTAVVTWTSLTPVFWSTQGGSPVVLPAMAEKRAGASETRAKWEGKERKMRAIGGWEAAKEYATGVKSAKEAREAGRGAKPTEAGKPFKQVAQELEAALRSNIYVVQVEAFGEVYGSIESRAQGCWADSARRLPGWNHHQPRTCTPYRSTSQWQLGQENRYMSQS
jgi:hypothetical protein